MTDSSKKSAKHWARHMMFVQSELKLMTQRLHQKNMSSHISLENWENSTWWLAYK